MKKQIKALAWLLMFVVSPSISNAQDAEKQKVIDVIVGEVNAYIKKDKAAWENAWIHSPAVKVTSAGDFYRQTVGWDAVEARWKSYWTSDVKFEGHKSDFNVIVEGNLAIVNLVEHWKGFPDSDQTVFLRKEKKEWKIFEMYNFFKDNDVEAGLNVQGYALLEKDVDGAIRIFTLNTELFPKSWNAWDSLGEAYLAKGDKVKAMENYQKSVDLNPKNETGLQALANLKK